MANAFPPNVAGVNISTPTGSNVGSFNWNTRDKDLIQKYREYYYEMTIVVNKLEDEGPDEIVFPKKPTRRLESLLEVQVDRTTLSGEDLNQYLQQNLVYNPIPYCPALDKTFPDIKSIEPFLIAGFQGLGANSSSSLICHMEFGRYLIQAYELFQQMKFSPHVKQSWADYLQINVGISDTYAKQMRVITEKFYKYKKFHHLGIPFNEVSSDF